MGARFDKVRESLLSAIAMLSVNSVEHAGGGSGATFGGHPTTSTCFRISTLTRQRRHLQHLAVLLDVL